VAKKNIMSLATINTILNTAPIVIQGATRLIKLIRDQGKDSKPDEDIPETIDGIKNEIERLHQRLDMSTESNLEQLKLIEELARQNESLATQLKNTMTHLNRITMLSILALIVSIVCLGLFLS
jgi:predicted PurR-regulated permease PerM